MNLKGNLTSKGLQGSIGKSRMQGILGTNPAAIPISVDNALSLSSTNPVQNRVITAAIANKLLSDEVKDALLQIVEKVVYIDEHGQDYYDALYDALYPPANLDSIGAVFDSSATIYNTDTLDDLKQYLVVTAYYTSGDSEVVTTYTLSGSMDAGTQTITVTYGGKTTTFTVTVVEWLVSIDAVFTQGSAKIYDTDTLDTLEEYLVVTATYADSTTATVSDYTLSGTLTAGTSTITVSYGGKTDTFSVTVTGTRLPAEYREVEYLEAAQTNDNTGAYISTGVAFNNPTTAIYRVGFKQNENSSISQPQHMMGTRETNTGATNNNGFVTYVNLAHAKLVSWANSPGASVEISDSYIRYDIVSTWKANEISIQVDDGAVVTTSVTNRGCSGYNIGVFGTPSNSPDYPGASYLFNGRIYYAQVEQDSVLLCNLVPCYRKSDNTPGMYCLVRNTFIAASKAGTNGNANKITAGPAV